MLRYNIGQYEPALKEIRPIEFVVKERSKRPNLLVDDFILPWFPLSHSSSAALWELP